LPSQKERSQSKRRNPEKGIQQRRFWEHVIRDPVDLRRHVDYNHYNPVKHGLVSRVSEWLYSSFHWYVREETLPPDWAAGMAIERF